MNSRAFGTWRLLLAGILLGMPVFFRSEGIVLYVVSFALVLGCSWRQWITLSSGLFVSGCLYLVFNMTCYGTAIPPHAGEVAGRSLLVQFGQGAINLASMSVSLVSVCPFVLFAILEFREKKPYWNLVVLCLGGMVLVPFIAPNPGIDDCGPRFWLFVIPPLALAALQCIWRHLTPLRRVPAILLILFSVVLSVRATSEQLPRIRLERTWPVMDLVDGLGCDAVLVGHQFAAQEMASLMSHNLPFFLVSDQNVREIADELGQHAIDTLAIVTYPDTRWGGWCFNPEDSVAPYCTIRSYDVGVYVVTVCRNRKSGIRAIDTNVRF